MANDRKKGNKEQDPPAEDSWSISTRVAGPLFSKPFRPRPRAESGGSEVEKPDNPKSKG